jgi:hypothetical protein
LRSGPSNDPRPLDPLRVGTEAQAARFLGRCLSYKETGGARSELSALLNHGEIDWLPVIHMANRCFLTPALHFAMRRKSLTHLLPTDLQDYLEIILLQNVKRNRLIAGQAAEFITLLNRRGIRPTLMKGAQSIFASELPEGVVMMADLDILLPEAEFAVGCQMLKSLGYASFEGSSTTTHATTFHRPGALATIDLHRHVGPQTRLLTAGEACRSAEHFERDGLALAGISATHRFLLSFMSYCLFEPQYRNRELPLRALHGLAVICRYHRRRIDWHWIDAIIDRHSLGRRLRVWLHLAQELLLVPPPKTWTADRWARTHLSACLLQLNHPRLARVLRGAMKPFWMFDAWRMDYRYGCGLEGWPLAVTRLRHAINILSKRSPILAFPLQELLPP